jgi:ABC-type transporter Mla subunit MlaD
LNFSKEVKIGFVGLILVFSILYLFNFLKQNNAFSTNMIITAKLENIEFLKKGNLVLIKGRPYGYVVAVYKVGDDLFVDMDIEGAAQIPPSAKAVISELSLLGGRTISIVYEGLCSDNCLVDGDIIPGEVYTMKEQVAIAAEPVLQKFGKFADTLMSPAGMKAMLDNAYASLSNLSKTTKGLEEKMKGMSRTLPASINNFKALTESFLNTDADQLKNDALSSVGDEKTQLALDSLINNLASLSQEDIDAMTKILYTAAGQLEKLPPMILKGEKAIENADKKLSALENKINGFQKGASGTIPKLLYNADFKDSLNNSIQNASQKIHDIRVHPELNISLKKKK